MTFIQKLKIKIGSNLIASATGRWHPKYPPEAYFYGDKSFSQCGEDLAAVNILMHLGYQGPVNYVDVGCFHPIQYSNTFLHYLNGGSGLVIDMNESHKSEFKRLRPRDKFISELVSDSTQPMQVRKRGSPMDKIIYGGRSEQGELKKPKPLSCILDQYWPKNKSISMFDIDCEGHDLEVLRSNNWRKYRPAIVVCEIFENAVTPEENKIDAFMLSQNYSKLAKIRMANFYFKKN
jgi:hypothetical protein